MNPYRPFVANYTQWLLVLAYCAVMLVASGCWQEVEYTPPAGAPQAGGGTSSNAGWPPADADAQADAAPAATPANKSPSGAGGFGEELEKSLVAGEPSATVDPADTTPIPSDNASSTPIVGDRYATTAPTPADSTVDSLFGPEDDSTSAPLVPETSPSNPPPSNFGSTPAEEPSAEANSTDSLFGESDAAASVPNPVNDSMLPEQREAIAEMSDEPIADLDDDDILSPPEAPRRNSRRAVWLLGSKLSLAALANDHGAAAAEVDKLFGQSRTLAEMLNVPLTALPARTASSGAAGGTDQGLDYLFGQGQEIGRALQGHYGPDHAALFEMAVKSNILLVIYQPGSPTADAIAAAISRAGPKSGLPEEMWQPLLGTLKSRADVANLRKVVFALHADADKYLATQITP